MNRTYLNGLPTPCSGHKIASCVIFGVQNSAVRQRTFICFMCFAYKSVAAGNQFYKAVALSRTIFAFCIEIVRLRGISLKDDAIAAYSFQCFAPKTVRRKAYK